MKRSTWVAILVFMLIRPVPVWADAPLVNKLVASDGAPDDYFGWSVSVSSDVCIIGADGDDNGGVNTGSAYIFRFQDPNWVEEVKLTAFDGEAEDYFGWSVSVSGEVCVVGARGDDDNGLASGSSYVFRFDGEQWIEEAKLTASDGETWDHFGHSVSISGNVCIVGAKNDYDNGDGSGSAYIFRYDGAEWIEEQKLTASDADSWDNFGVCVSMNPDVCLVGARGNDGYAGAAYVFRYSEPNWIQEAKLVAFDRAENDWFGTSVAIDDDVCVVGAVGDDDDGEQSGSAYVFRFDGADWLHEAKLTASDGMYYDDFGESVAVNSNVCLVGAYRDGDDVSYTGSAYVFRFEDPNWVEKDKLTAFDPNDRDYFGWSVSLDSGNAVIGANGKDANTGAAYAYAVATCPTADFNPDCFVNLSDLAVLSDEWLVLYDMDDLLTLAQQWLSDSGE
jgi:hypothetical protein